MISNRKHYRVTFVLAAVLIVIVVGAPGILWPSHISSPPSPSPPAVPITPTVDVARHAGQKPLRSRVAVATSFGAHFDVWLPVAQTAGKVLGSIKDVRVYGPPFLGFMFEEIADQLQIFPKAHEPQEDLIPAVKRDDLFPDEPGAMIDVVILGTCELDMDKFGAGLLEAWDARRPDQKFKLVCIVHNFASQDWHHLIGPWAARGAMRFLPIGEHVGTAYRRHFRRLADERQPSLFGQYLEHLDIDLHTPILDLPQYTDRREGKILSRAMIQGNFDQIRRDYAFAFESLIAALNRNAELWGYHSQPNQDPAHPRPYEPMANGVEPFTLHLAGNGELEIPVELENIVFTYRNLNYVYFYNLTQSMDIILPSFPNWDYCENQASSTAVMATQCGVPLLATKRIRKAYGYIDDDRVVVTRPQALHEMEALEIFRAHSLASLHEMYAPSTHGSAWAMPKSFVREVQSMLDKGFRRSQQGYHDFRKEMWQRNEDAMWRILNDLPGTI